MLKTDEVNINLIKAYIQKHYRIYKIDPLVPISKKHNRDYAFYVYETEEELSKWAMSQYLTKLFSVDVALVVKAMNEMADIEATKIQKQQLNIPYTGYFRKKKR